MATNSLSSTNFLAANSQEPIYPSGEASFVGPGALPTSSHAAVQEKWKDGFGWPLDVLLIAVSCNVSLFGSTIHHPLTKTETNVTVDSSRLRKKVTSMTRA